MELIIGFVAGIVAGIIYFVTLYLEDICGFCGKPGTDKIPHPVRWPGEDSVCTKYVHAECEDAECRRAHSLLSDKERESFLRTV